MKRIAFAVLVAALAAAPAAPARADQTFWSVSTAPLPRDPAPTQLPSSVASDIGGFGSGFGDSGFGNGSGYGGYGGDCRHNRGQCFGKNRRHRRFPQRQRMHGGFNGFVPFAPSAPVAPFAPGFGRHHRR